MLPGCARSGGVRLVLDLPTEPTLSPAKDERLASMTLLVEADGQLIRRSTSQLGDRSQALDLGEIPVDQGVRISLSGETQAGRMVGFGRAQEWIRATTDDELTVPIRLRRPFAYLAGSSALETLDLTLETEQAYLGTIDTLGVTAAAATTPDGAHIVVVAGDVLHLVPTATHVAAQVGVSLRPGTTEVAVTPDSRLAVVRHSVGNEPGLSFVDLTTIPASEATFVPISGSPGALAVSTDAAYVLVNASYDVCKTQTQVVPVPLSPPYAPGAAITLRSPASDVAVDPSSGALVLTQPCLGSVGLLSPGSTSDVVRPVLEVPSPSTVTVSAGRIVTVGQFQDASGAHLVLASIGLDETNPTRVTLPALEERARANPYTQGGQSAEVRIAADLAVAQAVAVAPDGVHVAVVVEAFYHANESGRFFGSPVIPAIDMTTHEYQLIDMGTGLPIQRYRTNCDLRWANDAVLNDFSCTSEPGQKVAKTPFVSTTITALYGTL
jgi:hypothetical protein